MSDSPLDKAYAALLASGTPAPESPKAHVTDPSRRFADLMKQGFWKSPKSRRAPAPPRPVVTCDDCLNWHTQGKHTAPADVRKANRVARQARLKVRT
jgi:hypothetical protein